MRFRYAVGRADPPKRIMVGIFFGESQNQGLSVVLEVTNMKRSTLIAVLLVPVLWSCQLDRESELTNPIPPLLPDTIRYLALGDSYTIGEGVMNQERFPVQLADSLRATGRWWLPEPRIIARTGWSTVELLGRLDRTNDLDVPYDLVTILIGVNNQFRGIPFQRYQTELTALIDRAITYTGGDTARVVLISIPDYSVTPAGQRRANAEQDALEIDRYNAEKERQARQYGLSYVYITDISRAVPFEPGLLAPDELHPSGLMYTRWVRRLRPVADSLLTTF